MDQQGSTPARSEDMREAQRILLVGNDAGYFFSHRLILAEALAQEGYEVHVAGPFETVDARMASHPFQYHYVPFTRAGIHPLVELRSLVSLYRLYRRLRPDIIHHFTIKPTLYGGLAAIAARAPAVVNSMTGLGYLFKSSERWTGFVREPVVRALRATCRAPNVRMIFQNPDDRSEFLERGLCADETSIVIRGSGVDVERFEAVPETSGTPVVLFASRMLWDKGVGDFVEAARRLKANAVEARFVLVGGTDPNPSSVSEDQLRQWNDEGVVEWWGRREDMPVVFGTSHIVCLPTAYGEGVPKALIEAASCARAIVTTDMPGCREIVHDGDNGLLVPVKDVEALVRAIRRLVEEPELRRHMGERGRERVVEEFSFPVVMRQTVAVYAGLDR
jgi:glycosyltransferase involved in cell wall biosynthesis